MLSGLSRGAGLVLAAKSDAILKHIEFIRLEPTKALAVLVGDHDQVENRVIDLPAGDHRRAAHRSGEFPQRPPRRTHACRGAHMN